VVGSGTGLLSPPPPLAVPAPAAAGEAKAGPGAGETKPDGPPPAPETDDEDETAEPSWRDPLTKDLLRDSRSDFWYNNSDVYMLSKGEEKEKEDDEDETAPFLGSSLRNRKHKKGDKKKGDDSDSDDPVENAKDMKSHFKKLLGIEDDINPDDAEWVTFVAARGKDGSESETNRKTAGDVLVSLEVIPREMVAHLPAGLGRADPNMNPELPKPTGRLKFTFNIFSLGAQFCGEGLFLKIFGCLICVGVVVAVTIGAPFINIMFQLLTALPMPLARFIIFCIVMLLLSPFCYCYWKYKCGK